MNKPFRLFVPVDSAAGFTLLELSIVLVVISLLVGFSVMLGSAQINAARSAQTYTKMAALEKALLAYRRANNRLPCPAVITVPVSDAGFGLEDTTANCGGTTSLSGGGGYGRGGVIPVITLGLPADFMFDGWGLRFDYAVDYRVTAVNALDSAATPPGYSISDTTIGDLQVNDASGATITSKAIYVLLSHGENALGGYNSIGALVSNPGNADEKNNCNCGPGGTIDNIWVQKSQTGDMSTPANYFDDIVHYKMRSQMPNYDE